MVEYYNRYIVGHAILNPNLVWRYHGIGLLQTYLHEGDLETRVHIWDPILVLPQFHEANGLVHDHRFSFTSFVLLGAIYDERWYTEEHPAGEYQIHSTVNARKFKEEKGIQYGAHTEPEPEDSRRYNVNRCGTWYNQGQRYEMAPRQFHHTIVQDFTVTLIVKRSVVHGPAKIITKVGETLVNAFDHDQPVNLGYVKRASAKLLGEIA